MIITCILNIYFLRALLCHVMSLLYMGYKISGNNPLVSEMILKSVSYTHLDVYKRQGKASRGNKYLMVPFAWNWRVQCGYERCCNVRNRDL